MLDTAVAHHHNAIGELERLFLIVGDEHRGMAGLLVHLQQPAAELFAHLCVESAEGFIEQQQTRLDGERAGEGDALTLTA